MSNKEKRSDFAWLENFRYEHIRKASRNPGLAALMSFFVMGLGQIYAGHIDKGIILVTVQFIFGIFSYNIFTNGFLYELLNNSLGANLSLFFIFIFFVIFIIVWIYNIKEAYYLSIFSSFRDWFEIERVLLPAMGVPEDMLISNSNSMLLLENKTEYNSEFDDSESDKEFIKINGEEEKIVEENENVINIKEVEKVKEKEKEKEEEKQEEENNQAQDTNKNTYSSTSALVYMNSNSWKIYWALVLLIIFSGIFICYSFQKKQDEMSFQITRNFEVSSNNKIINLQNNQESNTKEASITNNSISKNESEVVSKKELENYIDEKIQSQLAINQDKIADLVVKNSLNNNTNSTENNNTVLNTNLDSEIESETVNNEKNQSSNNVIFIQGHKETTLVKTNAKNNNSKKILYEAPDNRDSDDVELVMIEESKINDDDIEPTIEKNVVFNSNKTNNPEIPSVKQDKIIDLDKGINNKKEIIEKTGKDVKKEVITKSNIDNTKKGNNKINNKLSIKIESPEEKAIIEKIKEKGASEFYQGNWEAALPYYFELLKHRRDAETFEMIGLLFEKMNKNEDAFEAYENAYTLGQNSVHHLARLGFTAEKIGKYEKAQKYLEKAIEKNPKRADVILCYARCLNNLGEDVAAAQVLAVLRENTDSYAIKKAADYEYQKIVESNSLTENSVARE